jgi:hypothetical protein
VLLKDDHPLSPELRHDQTECGGNAVLDAEIDIRRRTGETIDERLRRKICVPTRWRFSIADHGPYKRGKDLDIETSVHEQLNDSLPEERHRAANVPGGQDDRE